MNLKSKKALVLLLASLIILSSFSFTSLAVSETGSSTISVSVLPKEPDDIWYLGDATVTKLPAPYLNGTYDCYCADLVIDIEPGTLYEPTNFSKYTGSRRIAYILNDMVSTDKKVKQQLIWKIINGRVADPTSEVQLAVDSIWDEYFMKLEGDSRIEKPDSEFPETNSANYPNEIFIANSGENIQPILVVVPKLCVVTFIDPVNTVWDRQVVNYNGDATTPTSPSQPNKVFVGWDIPYVHVTRDITVTAVYTPVILPPPPTPNPTYYQVVISKTGEGTVQTGTYTVQSGDFIIGSILPGANYTLGSITGANGSEVTSLEGNYRISVNSNKEIIVNFVTVEQPIDVPEEVVPEVIVPESVPVVTQSSIETKVEEVILDSTVVPEAGLPNTGALPLSIPLAVGAFATAFGYILKKRDNN